MTTPRAIVTTVTVLSVVMTLSTQATTHASVDGLAINGAYEAVSDGQWAKTNGRYEDQISVTATWSVTSSCTSYLDCTGRVSSDQGWTADLIYQSGIWRVTHPVEDWLKCADGTANPGEQTFAFWPDSLDPVRLVGFDKTVGPSGACGVNRPVTIDISFKLTPAA